MDKQRLTASGKPLDLHERLLLFAHDIVRATQFLHNRGAIGRALSYQILAAGTSVGTNSEQAEGAPSHRDFIARQRVALKEAKEVRFRLRVCRKTELLDEEFDPLIQESDELVHILDAIVHVAARRERVLSSGAALSLALVTFSSLYLALNAALGLVH